jgi:Flp pilus assembly pilin Flp
MGLIEHGWVLYARLQAWSEAALADARSRTSGQSTVEYALVGALVVIAAAGAMTLLGGEITNVFSKITTTLSGAASASH